MMWLSAWPYSRDPVLATRARPISGLDQALRRHPPGPGDRGQGRTLRLQRFRFVVLGLFRSQGLAHQLRHVSGFLSYRLGLARWRFIIDASPEHNPASGVDVDNLTSTPTTATDVKLARSRRSVSRRGWAGCQLYNSAMYNIDHLMFEYILNWPDHRLAYSFD